jgi:periplasmic protein TonB
MSSLLRCLFMSVACVLFSAAAWAQADDTVHTKVDENPVPVKTPPPKYPDSLKREGVSGVVAVVLVIDEKGGIMSSTISKSSHPDFERPALEAVKNWKFKPAKKDGNPVKVRVTIPLRFNVDEG